MPGLIRSISNHAVRVHDGYGTIVPGEEILLRARLLAKELTHNGTRCAGLRLDNGIDWIVADLACQFARIPLVPIPLFFTECQVRHVAETTGMDTLIGTIDGIRQVFREFQSCGDDFPFWAGAKHERQLPSGTTKITFTSGTTGAPKGVCLSRAQQERVARQIAHRTSELGLRKHLAVLPLPVLLENVAGVYGAFMSGADVAVPPLSWVGVRGSSGFDPAVLLEAIRNFQPDSLILLPQMLKDLVRQLERNQDVVRGLKFVAVGGAATAPELIEKSRSLGLPVHEGYGLTEAGSVVSLNLPDSDRVGTVGQALFPDSIRLNDRKEIEIFLPEGVRYLGGPNRAKGWFRTGDLGAVDTEGYLRVAGRRKAVLVTAFGRNISPEWVEKELLADPRVSQAMALGDGQRALGALVVPSPGADAAGVARAVSACNGRLPDYAQIAAWRIVPAFTTENGQLTATGRVRRSEVEAAHKPLIATLIEDIETHTWRDPMDFYDELVRDTEAERRILLEQPVITDCLAGVITLPIYRAFLEQAYHHVRHTVPLLMACGARLPTHLEWLRRAVAEYIEEETGHEEWILNDIRACGGDAEKVRASQPAMATDVMVAYAWDGVLRRNPVGFFGMVLVLEGTSVQLASAAADIIQKRLKLPEAAFSYLRSHGQLDREHIEFFKSLINRLEDEKDRAAVRDTARTMYHLYARVFAGLPRAGERREAA